jgi:hypothetical protein
MVAFVAVVADMARLGKPWKKPLIECNEVAARMRSR